MGGNCLAESLSSSLTLLAISSTHISLYPFSFFSLKFPLVSLTYSFYCLKSMQSSLCSLFFFFLMCSKLFFQSYILLFFFLFPLRCQYYEHLLCVDCCIFFLLFVLLNPQFPSCGFYLPLFLLHVDLAVHFFSS